MSLKQVTPLLGEPLAEAQGYGLYSARYGNIYTARQLRQLIDRAYGNFSPVEDIWTQPDGSVLDPFRPSVQPGGFAFSVRNAGGSRLASRLRAGDVRDSGRLRLHSGPDRMLECHVKTELSSLSVQASKAVYSIPEKHVFHNLTVMGSRQ